MARSGAPSVGTPAGARERAMCETLTVRRWRARAALLVVMNATAIGGATPGHATMMTYGPPGGSVMVPPGVTQMTFDLYGAQGGGGLAASVGGLGGRATATIDVTPGTSLLLTVGRAGDNGVQPGYNGGGNNSPTTGGGVGGGATDLRLNDAVTKLLVAGGGGGGGADSVGLVGGDGGPGGAMTSVAGMGGDGIPHGGANGGGGGGGGGGWFGGGGGGGGGAGATGSAPGGGGGGGSSYGPAGTTFEIGVRSGDGSAIVTYTDVSTTTTIAGASTTSTTVPSAAGL